MNKFLTGIKISLITILSLTALIIAGLSIYVSFEELIQVFVLGLTIEVLASAISVLILHVFVFLCVIFVILGFLIKPFKKPLLGKSRLPINRR